MWMTLLAVSAVLEVNELIQHFDTSVRMRQSGLIKDVLITIPIFFNWLLKCIWEYYTTRWLFNNALAQNRTPFGQISQHDLHKYCLKKYRFCALYLLHQYFKLAFELTTWHKKKTLACQNTDRAHWSNRVDERAKCKHATIRQHWQRSDPMAFRHRQIGGALIQWHTGIIRLTVL